VLASIGDLLGLPVAYAGLAGDGGGFSYGAGLKLKSIQLLDYFGISRVLNLNQAKS
jgi:hypothetical protein